MTINIDASSTTIILICLIAGLIMMYIILYIMIKKYTDFVMQNSVLEISQTIKDVVETEFSKKMEMARDQYIDVLNQIITESCKVLASNSTLQKQMGTLIKKEIDILILSIQEAERDYAYTSESINSTIDDLSNKTNALLNKNKILLEQQGEIQKLKNRLTRHQNDH